MCSIFLQDKHAKYAATGIITFGYFSDLIKLVKSMKKVDRGVLVLTNLAHTQKKGEKGKLLFLLRNVWV